MDAKRDALVDRLMVRLKERRPFEERRLDDPKGYLLLTILEDAACTSERQYARIGMAAMRIKERSDESAAYYALVEAFYDGIEPWLDQGMTVEEAIEAYERAHPDTPLPELFPVPDWFIEDPERA